MPCKKKKYNSRFPPARIKKIMQSDDEVGKVAAVVPIIISRVLEIFVENLLKDSCEITKQRNARTLTPAHIKASILQNNQLDFLKEIVSLVPDIQTSGEDEQIADFNHATDYYSSSNSNNNNNSNHHKFIIKQYSHPATSLLSPSSSNCTITGPSQVSLDSGNSLTALNNLMGMSNLDLNSLITNNQINSSTTGQSIHHHNQSNTAVVTLDSMMENSERTVQNSSKRFKKTYTRCNSAPCTTMIKQKSQYINNELREVQKSNRSRKRQADSNTIAYEDDEDTDLDESLSDESNADERNLVDNPSTSSANDNSQMKQNKLEIMEDDDYDA